MEKRTIIVGDVHGCFAELQELLHAVQFCPGDDRLVFVGDLVDRGPDSAAVVRYVRAIGAECVMGNHEEKHVRWAQRESAGKVNNMNFPEHKQEIQRQLTDADRKWMSELPTFLRLDEKWVVVHAGFEAGIPLEKQRPDICTHIRYAKRESGKMAHVGEDLLTPATACFWTDLWRGPENVIYGHHPSARPHVIESAPGVWCYGIDTGCCFGDALTALLLPSRDLISVPARTQYWSKHAEHRLPR